MLLLYSVKNQLHFALTERNIYKGVHSGQISLPGGRMEKEDIDLQATALRETYEEIGIIPASVEVLGNLSTIYIPPSKSIVYPYIGYLPASPLYKIDSREVNKIIEFPFDAFKEITYKNKPMKMSTGVIIKDVPYFDILGYTVWGATAMILNEFKHIMEKMKAEVSY